MFTLRDVWRNAHPTGAVADLRLVFQQAGSNRWRIAVLAAATTFSIFYMLMGESWKAPRPKPDIIYIRTFAPNRTEAEIIASNIANQKRKDALAAEQAKRDADVREIYMKLGRMSGMDVNQIAAEGDAERAAAAAKAKAEQQQALERADAVSATQSR